MTRRLGIITIGLLGIAACGGRKDAAELANGTPAKPDSLVPIADAAPPSLPPAQSPQTVYVDRSKEPPPRPAPRILPRPSPANAPSSAGQDRPPVAAEPLPAQPLPAPRAAVLEAGTVIDGNVIDSIHSRYTKVGDVVHMRVARDLTVGNRVVIPSGSVISLTVTAIGQAPDRDKKGTLSLAAQSVEINGRTYPVSGEATDYQYEMKARGVGAGDAAKVGGGAVVGGLIGRVIGGNKTGTIVGAVGGAAAGAAVASKTADRDIIVHAGGTVAVTLRDPFSKSP